ncbi:uncharacterized protein LOC132752715 [Ruditapes philippinarum]|uniref:uncharacterized protein LOC132752715 n=1 Tax=Ruditapes philippinarum TaxID=129788 RepID=UPI00295AD4A8|nr:uncharacterized protein LOC132752715 [Ruditapes philippinarum]
MEDSSYVTYERPNKDDLTRVHEYYLSHLLLLEQASPIALKAIIKRELDACGKDIAPLLNENKDSFKTKYEAEYLQLFQDDTVNSDFDSWDTLQLCAAIFFLFKSDLADQEVKAIQCIYDLRKDIENVESASLTYNTYKEKQRLLREQLLELVKLIGDHDKLYCKRMMYSFEPTSIHLSEQLKGSLKQTNDVKTHLKIAMKENVVTQVDINNGEDNEIWPTNDHIFTEELQNKNVYINDSVVLRCKLNSPASETVVWKKDSLPVEMTDNIVFMGNHCTHWLAITHASLEDTGNYACVCGNISTSANLTVKDERLILVFDLPLKSKATENENIALECGVNMRTSEPVWRHDGEEIQSCSRYLIQVEGTKHILTIKNVTFQDEGEYTVDFGEVSSKTTVIIQGETDVLHRIQLTEELFQNWVRSVLALKYLKVGLEEFSDKVVQEHHDDILSSLQGTCNTCTEESLLPHKHDQCPHQNKQKCLCSKNQKQKSGKMCPNGFCGKCHDRIVCDHRFRDPLLANTDVRKWSSDPWSVATCFINTTGYKDKQSAKDVDCSGLLSLFINNVFIEMMLGEDIINGKSDAFSQAREARNDIHHSSNYEMSENQLDNFINLFREVLEIKDKHGNMPLKDEPGVQEALRSLDVVQQNQIEINFEHEMEQLRAHGMYKLEEKCQAGKEQLELKLQQMEQQLKDKDNELQLKLNLQSSGEKKLEGIY